MMNLMLRLWILVTSLLSFVISIKLEEHNFETVHTSNAAVLNRLGLTPIEIPPSHFKKRVSGPEPQLSSSSSSLHYSSAQSRIHQPYSRRDGHHDSHVYMVKLPASPTYYTVTKPVNPINKDDKKKSSIKSGTENITFDNGSGSSTIHKTPSVGFNSNGKPAKIYHWNLPLMRKINEKKRLHAQFKMDLFKKNYLENNINKILQNYDDKKLMNYLMMSSKLNDGFKKKLDPNMIENYSNKYSDGKNHKQTRNNDKLLNYYKENSDKKSKINELFNKFNNENNGTRKLYRLEDDIFKVKNDPNVLADDKNYFDKNFKIVNNFKKRKVKTPMTFYAPIPTETTGLSMSNNIKKNFSGNGKPKAFYVMEKSRRKPIYYHSLLP